MDISIIGSGYVGLITGAGFAKLGHHVICVDVDEKKVTSINSAIPPIHEDDLPELLQEVVPDNLKATLELDNAIKSTSVTFIGVGTPPLEDGSADLTYMKTAAEGVGKALKDKEGYHIIIVKSTVIPGTTDNVVGKIIEEHSGKKVDKDFGLVMSPEFLREGKALDDFFNPVRVVIGARDKRAIDILEDLYKPFNTRVIITDPKVAELIKYTSNAFLATKISFANEIGNLAKGLGIDVYEVMDAVGLDPRIGREFLNAGPGYGGSCLPKDIDALMAKAREIGVATHLLEAVREVNNEQPLRMIALAEERLGSLKGKTIGILGVAFKPDTDDVRESQAIPIYHELIRRGAEVVAHDPRGSDSMLRVIPDMKFVESAKEAVDRSDAVLILTGWREHASTDLYKDAIVIDGRRLVPENACKEYVGLCW